MKTLPVTVIAASDALRTLRTARKRGSKNRNPPKQESEHVCRLCADTERIPCLRGCSGGDYCNKGGCTSDTPNTPGTVWCSCSPNHEAVSLQESSAKMAKNKCSIEGCGNEPRTYHGGQGPYCYLHERLEEWAFCFTCRAFCEPATEESDIELCAKHGGQDCTPRTSVDHPTPRSR